MNRFLTIFVLLMVALAGCSGGVPPTETSNTPGISDDTAGPTASASTGTVDFYVSDRPNAINEFDHLTVNITKIGFHRAGSNTTDDNDTATTVPTGPVNVSGEVEYTNETFPPNGSVALDGNLSSDGTLELDGTVPNGTINTSGTVDDSGNVSLTGTVSYNETQFPTHPNGTVTLNGSVSQAGTVELNGTVTLFGEDTPSGTLTLTGTVTQEETETDDSGAGWIEHEVNAQVDLTEVVNDDAQLIDTMNLSTGKYTAVFVYVGDINASVNDTQVTVKLPSDRLMLNKNFMVTENETVDFVYDIGVHKAGRSGKYILRPVVSESGTDVPINAVETTPGPDNANANNSTDTQENSPPDKGNKPDTPPGQAAKDQQSGQ